jgi:hypothetical protein
MIKVTLLRLKTLVILQWQVYCGAESDVGRHQAWYASKTIIGHAAEGYARLACSCVKLCISEKKSESPVK